MRATTQQIRSSQLLFWGLFALLAAALVYPFAGFRYPSMADYPNHLARIHIITGQAHDAWQQHYIASHDVVPNLALDYFVPVAMQFGMHAETGLKLFAAIALLAPVFGTICLGYRIQKQLPWVTLLALPLAYSRYYVWGFLNYFFSLGVALLLLAYWVGIREPRSDNGNNKESPSVLHGLLLSTGICALLYSHLVGYALFLVTVITIELYPAETAGNRRRRNIRALIAAIAPSVVLYLVLFKKSTAGLQVQYYDFFFGKFAGLASVFYTYQLLPAVLTLTIALAAFAIVVHFQQKTITIPNTYILPLAVLILIFLASPAAMMGSAFLDRRLAIFICFVGLAAMQINYSKPIIVTLSVAAIALVAVKLVEAIPIWRKADAALTDVRKALLIIEPGARLVQHPVLPNGGRDDLASLRHASAFAVIDRGAFIPTLFAQPYNGESIAYLNPSTSSMRYDEGKVVTKPQEINWTKVCIGYEYVLLTGEWTPAPLPDCLKKIAKGPGYELSVVNRNRTNDTHFFKRDTHLKID